MRAFQLFSHDAPARFADLDPVPPAPGQVQIAVAACGLNFADLLMMRGQYQERPALPLTLGMEVAGHITALGDGVTGLHPGQRVAAFVGHGGLAARVTCDAQRCVGLPDALSLTDAAAIPVAYGTSHLALSRRAGLQQGESLLVLGAASGVGLSAVEIGAQMGARVIAVARGADKLAIARGAGAAHSIDADTPDLRAALRDLGGVDVVYDAIGEPLATPALRSLHPEGRYLTIGFAGGQVPQFPANILLVKNLTVIGLYWGGYLRFNPAALTDSLAQMMDWAGTGRLRPHVSHVLPLDRVQDGYDLLRARKSTGKVVIVVAP